jgi:hypothetical protein
VGDGGPSSDGSIELTVSNGSGFEVFSWTGPGGYTANTEDINGLIPGTYDVTVTDGLCTTVTSATVNQPLAVTASAIPTHASCVGDAGPSSDGSVDLTVTNGSGNP